MCVTRSGRTYATPRWTWPRCIHSFACVLQHARWLEGWLLFDLTSKNATEHRGTSFESVERKVLRKWDGEQPWLVVASPPCIVFRTLKHLILQSETTRPCVRRSRARSNISYSMYSSARRRRSRAGSSRRNIGIIMAVGPDERALELCARSEDQL